MARTLFLCSSPYQAFKRLSNDETNNNALIITPGPRAARIIGASHCSLDKLALKTLEKHGISVASSVMAYRTLQRAVREIGLYSDIPGTVNAVAPSIKELLRSEADLAYLIEHNDTRIRALAQVTALYKQKLQEKGLVDSAELFITARGYPESMEPLMIYGYALLAPDEIAYIHAISGEGTMLFLPYHSHNEALKPTTTLNYLQQKDWEIALYEDVPETYGEKLSLTFIQGDPAPANTWAFAYPHQEAEVRGTLRRVKELLLAGESISDIVLVTREDKAYGPILLAIGWEYEIPVRVLYSMPIIETGFGAWLKLLLAVVGEKLPYENTLRLLSHSYSKKLDDRQLCRARENHPQSLLDWRAYGINTEILNWPDSDSPASWLKRLHLTFKYMGLPKTIAHSPRELNAFLELQAQLPHLESANERTLSQESFIRELTETMRLLTIPAQPGKGGIELHTPLDLFGTQYKYIFILGMAEGLLPAQIKDDLQLDFTDRAKLMDEGIPLKGIEKFAFQEGLTFYALLQAATHSVTFSYPKLIQNKEMLESAYFSDLGIDPIRADETKLGSIEEARRVWLLQNDDSKDPMLPAIRHAFTVESDRESGAFWNEYDGVTGIPVDPDLLTFSASQLTKFGQCNFKWFADRLLSITNPEEAETELSALLQGNLYHKVLELAAERTRDLGTTQEAMLAILDDAFVEAEDLLGLKSISLWPARRAEHLDRLRHVIASPEFLPEGHQILAQEISFAGTWQGLNIKGKIDRIDKTTEGLVFIDYKTRSTAPKGIQDKQGQLKLDIQLPIYVEAATPVLFPEEKAKEAYYFSITKGKILKRSDTSSEEALRQFVAELKEQLQAGSFPVRPDKNGDACEYCEFDLLCRKGPRLNTKGIPQ